MIIYYRLFLQQTVHWGNLKIKGNNSGDEVSAPPVLSAPKFSVSLTILGEKMLKFTVQIENLLRFLAEAEQQACPCLLKEKYKAKVQEQVSACMSRLGWNPCTSILRYITQRFCGDDWEIRKNSNPFCAATGQLWNCGEMHLLVTFITEHKPFMFPRRKQQRNKRKIQKTGKHCVSSLHWSSVKPLFLHSLNPWCFNLTQCPPQPWPPENCIAVRTGLLVWDETASPRKEGFLGQAPQSWQKTCLHSCRESPKLQRDRTWSSAGMTLPPAVLEMLCPWCASSRQRVPQGKVLGPVISKLGQKRFTCTRKKHIFIPLSPQNCQEQTLLFLLRKITPELCCCSFSWVTQGRFIPPAQLWSHSDIWVLLRLVRSCDTFLLQS